VTSRICRTAAALALLGGLAGGCATPSGGTSMDPQAELDARPRSAEMVSRYEQMQQRIRGRLDAELGPFSWQVRSEGDRAGCGGEFANSAGMVVYLPRWGFDGGISDADWPRARQIVGEITAEYGFTTPTLQIDRPGDHETSAADEALGAQYNFATQANTSIAVTTGCHLDDSRAG
jgi:hypothetical protein